MRICMMNPAPPRRFATPFHDGERSHREDDEIPLLAASRQVTAAILIQGAISRHIYAWLQPGGTAELATMYTSEDSSKYLTS